MNTIITDTDVSDSAVQWLEQSGIKVITVATEPLPKHEDEMLANLLLTAKTGAIN